MPFALKSFLLLIVGNKATFQYIAAYQPLTLAADVLFCACSHLHHIPHWISYLRILGMLRHSACVSRQTHTSRYVLSISSNAAKRRFKDKRFTSYFIITTSIKKCNIFLQKNSRHLWRLRSDSELLIISHLRLP